MNSSFFLKNILSEYVQVETGRNYKFFSDINSCVYFWYFPISLKSKNSSINEALNHYFKEEFYYYNNATKFEILDNRRKIKSTLELVPPSSFINAQFSSKDDELFASEGLSSLLLATCLFSNPIYIGKATRTDNIKKRLEEHLSLRTDFSKELKKRLEGTTTSINDLVIVVLDLQKIEQHFFANKFHKDFEFAEFIERLLINHFKPAYNIRN